ncbi:MAG: terminase small subunit [Candidatus Faecousia sp.]|nr:terminase small subunit [Candidatus Faecousia sp.]
MGKNELTGALGKRIRSGSIRKQDVIRRLAELAFGRANDCVKLVLEDQPNLEELDLTLLSEVKRNEKGTVEVRLIDRLRALEALSAATGGQEGEMEAFLQALRGGDTP